MERTGTHTRKHTHNFSLSRCMLTHKIDLSGCVALRFQKGKHAKRTCARTCLCGLFRCSFLSDASPRGGSLKSEGDNDVEGLTVRHGRRLLFNSSSQALSGEAGGKRRRWMTCGLKQTPLRAQVCVCVCVTV